MVLYVLKAYIPLVIMSSINPTCRVCDVVLNSENCYPSFLKNRRHVCKECQKEKLRLWREANPEKVRAQWTREDRKQHHPFSENTKCSLFLGIHVAERVLSHVFKDVKRMPIHNPGYDFICNKGKRVDVKSSCLRKTGNNWTFHIQRNTIADFFLCLTFDNLEDLNPLYAWLIPGSVVNHLRQASISKGTVHKWDEYKLDTSKINTCCNELRQQGGFR